MRSDAGFCEVLVEENLFSRSKDLILPVGTFKNKEAQTILWRYLLARERSGL